MRIMYTLVFLTAVCMVTVSAQCPPNALDLFVQCLGMIFPHPKDHPGHAAIIGRGNIEYARDMCFSEGGDDFSWRKGVECVFDLEQKCLSAKAGQIIRALYNKDRFEAAMTKFCYEDRLNAYEANCECYTDNRVDLGLCKLKEVAERISQIVAKPNMTVSEFVGLFCSTRDECVVCQDDVIRKYCGREAADPIYNIMYDLRGPGCSQATVLTMNFMLLVMGILVAILRGW